MLFSKILLYYEKRKKPVSYSRRIGVQIGDSTRLMGTPNWGSEPWLISIGRDSLISFGVTFITHDGAISCFRKQEEYRNVVKFGRIRVGDNCFIGAKSIFLTGVTVGSNSIVAAGAVVSKDIPPSEVWGGVPAHFIMTTKEYAEKCKHNTPAYDLENYKRNFKEEVNRICDMVESKK